MSRLTPDAFSALAELLRLRDGPAREAARLVLVEGVPTAEAARQVGLSYRAAWNAVKRCERGLVLAHTAVRVHQHDGGCHAPTGILEIEKDVGRRVIA